MGLISNFLSQASDWLRLCYVSPRALFLIRFAFLASVYSLTTRISLSFAVLPGTTSPLWFASAIALCGCLAWGQRMAAAVFLGAYAAHSSVGMPPGATLIIAAGCMLEAAAASHLVQRFYRTKTDFIYHGTVFRFIGIALASSTISASAGMLGMSLALHASSATLGLNWLIWWLGDTVGMIVGVPLILAWNVRSGIEWRARKLLELAAFAILLPTITQMAFGGTLRDWPVAYLAIPFFLWAALRFNLATVTWTTTVVCAIAVWNTMQGDGPFARDNFHASLLLVMAYVSVVASMGLVLAQLAYQRSSAESLLREERDDREHQVWSRTHALVSDIEERKRIEQELAARERQLAEAQRLAHLGSWNWEVDTNKYSWSDELYRIYGVDRENFTLTRDSVRALIHEADQESLRDALDECQRSGKPFHVEYRVRQPGGQIRTVSARGEVLRDNDGRIVRVIGTVQDITDAKRAEASLREAEERYRKVVELSPDAILVQQDAVIVYANPAAVRLLKAGCMNDIVGKSLFDLLHPDFHMLARERIAGLQRGENLPPVEEKFRRLDGSEVDVEVTSSPFLHRGRFASLFIMRDITERKKTVEQMAYLAHYDSLTGLPNRMMFHQRLEHALSIAERPSRSLEVLFLDLDRFKTINDTLGHATGDIVLKEAASRLQGILRESDTVARLGGDEFVVLVENVDEPHRGGIIAEKILAAFVPPFMRDKEPLSISTSIGISSFPSDGIDAETLLKKADIAMYRAKERGRNNYCYFSPEMNKHTAERLFLENALSQAIEQNQLSLHYQPKIDILTSRITGMEALLRWQHPTVGAIAPHRFIPIAEETGLIRTIGYWAIRAACRQNKHWQATSPARLKVAVNLSARQLSDENLVENIEAILEDTGLDPEYLEIEVSESVITNAPDEVIAVLNKLREHGMTIAIDDFGVGHSSLAYLKRFPVRAVKIDSSFVQGLPGNDGDSAITKAIISLAHTLECSVTAEGAETQQQYDFLREHACDSVQGFYFSAPMPAEHFEDLLRLQPDGYLH